MLMVQHLSLLDSSFIKLKYASPSLLLMGSKLPLTLVPHRPPLSPAYRESCKELEVVACQAHLGLLLCGMNLLLGVLFPKLETQAFLGNGQPKVKNSGQKV